MVAPKPTYTYDVDLNDYVEQEGDYVTAKRTADYSTGVAKGEEGVPKKLFSMAGGDYILSGVHMGRKDNAGGRGLAAYTRTMKGLLIGLRHAYLMRVYQDTDNEGAIKEIMVFNTNTEVKKYKISENLRINGFKVKQNTVDDRLKTAAQLVNRNNVNSAGADIAKEYSQLIKMMVKDDTVEAMEILVAETAAGRTSLSVPDTQLCRHKDYTASTNTQFVITHDTGSIYRWQTAPAGTISGAGVFRPAAITFHVPYTDSTDPTQYQIKSISQRSNLVMDFFDVNNMRAEVAVSYQDVANATALGVGSNNSTGWWVMFDSKEYTLDEDDEPIMKFNVVKYNGTAEYYTKDPTVMSQLNSIEKGALLVLYGIDKEVTQMDVAEYGAAGGARRPIGPNNLPTEYISSGAVIDGTVSNIGQGFAEGGGSASNVRAFDVYDSYSSAFFCLQTGALQDGKARLNQIIGYKRNAEWQKGGVLLYEGDGTKGNGICKNGTVEDLRTVMQYGPSGSSFVFAAPTEGGARMYIVYNLNK